MAQSRHSDNFLLRAGRVASLAADAVKAIKNCSKILSAVFANYSF